MDASSLTTPARYRCVRSDSREVMAPDAIEDTRAHLAGPDGWITAAAGDLFHGRTVAWQALTVKDQGIDIECEWESPVFVDRIVLDAAVLDQVQRVRILHAQDGRRRQVGQADLSSRTTDEFVLERSPRIGIDVGTALRRCIIRLETKLAEIVLTDGIEVIGLNTAPLGIFPAHPIERRSGTITVAELNGATITAHGAIGGAAERIVAHAVSGAAEAVDVSWTVGQRQENPQDKESLVIALDPAAAPAPAVDVKPEGFLLDVTEDRISITGDEQGLRHGIECVLQQLIMDGRVRAGRFVEEPRHRFRGVHLPLPGPSQLEYFRRLVRWLVVPSRFNTVIVEIAGGMEFRSHPEINEVWRTEHDRALAGERKMPGHFTMVAPGETLSQDETRDLVVWMKSLGLDVVPEIQSLSHVQYLTLAHPEIAEIAGEVDNTAAVDLFDADQPAAKDPSCYCPSNPRSYELIDDLIAEIIDVFEPEHHVHLGHDEVYELGVCPTCRSKDVAQLFADDLGHLIDTVSRVSRHPVRPMIWSDMVQPDATYRAAAALDQLPDDLLMLDFIWYFDRERDIEHHLLAAGHEVAVGNLYASHFPRWEARSAQPGMIGGQVSTWVSTEDAILAREGKFFDFPMVAVMLWSDRYHRHHHRSLSMRIATWLTDLRSRLTGQVWTTGAGGVDLLVSPVGDGLGRPDSDPVLAALTLRAGAGVSVHEARGELSPYEIGHAIAVPASDADHSDGATATLAVPAGISEIHLLHALTRPVARTTWQELLEVGRYVVSDDRGEIAVQPITGGGTAGHLFTRYASPLQTSYYRHQGWTATYSSDPVQLGQTDDGRDLCLYRTVLSLPALLTAEARLQVQIDADAGTALVLAAAVGR